MDICTKHLIYIIYKINKIIMAKKDKHEDRENDSLSGVTAWDSYNERRNPTDNDED